MPGLYVHIPFCKRRCVYCDFYSCTLGDDVRRRYVDALCREMALRRHELPSGHLSTIYFGGGTPSQLLPEEFERLFNQIYAVFTVDEHAEITLEANPDDLSPAYVSALRRSPVNRISMGVQTFSERLLKVLHRRHTAAQAMQAIERCAAAGFGNISADLIYGLPDQSLSDWKTDLQTMLERPITHLSAYALIYEEGTELWNMRCKHLVEEADEELSLHMFEHLMDRTAEAGWTHYEISNFCKPGFTARHNSSYWTGEPYLGCGPSAHSYDGTNRQWNRPDIEAYLKAGGNVYAEDETRGPIAYVEHLTEAERYNDTVITALRTLRGLPLHEVDRRFGSEALRHLLRYAAPHIKRKTLERIAPTPLCPQGVLRLTRSGIYLSDSIMSDLLMVE